MRAVTFRDVGLLALEEVERPTIEEPGDVVVRVTTTAICGSDLHILNGRIPGMVPGGVLGHEFIGVVEEVGSDVGKVREGDRVLASFIVPCGQCWYCTRNAFSRCPDARVFGYGSFFGDLGGGQAEYVRIPNADLSSRPLAAGMSDERALFAGDIFTTAVDGASNAQIEPGDCVVVQGCGPVGLLAIQAAQAFQPGAVYAVDTVPARLAVAAGFGAIPVNAADVHVPTYVQEQTGERGCDVLLECVGALPALTQAIDTVRPGGRIAVIGVYSEPEYELPISLVFVKGIDLRFGGTANIIGRWDEAMRLIADGTVDPAAIISHRLPLDRALEGYELFESREALKVVLTV
ncbi:MAG: alcohol dehydrogenase catalytic domain-containing protein [Candidatus Dormibacteria bacterium]